MPQQMPATMGWLLAGGSAACRQCRRQPQDDPSAVEAHATFTLQGSKMHDRRTVDAVLLAGHVQIADSFKRHYMQRASRSPNCASLLVWYWSTIKQVQRCLQDTF